MVLNVCSSLFSLDCSSHTNEFLRECQGAAILENDPCRGRSRLNERERRQAALPILVFGNEMVSTSSRGYFVHHCQGLGYIEYIFFLTG